MKKLKRIAIIPARGGSKRIKNKNLVEFNGKPIIFYTISNAVKSKLFDKIHVSTNSLKVLNYLKKIKFEPEFKRPKIFSGEKSPISETLKYVIKKYEENKVYFDEVWLLYACAPLVTHVDLVSASKKYRKTQKKYPLMSVCEYDAPIEWAFKKKRNFLVPINKKFLTMRSQDIKKSYYESATFMIFKKFHLFKKNNFRFYDYKLKKGFGIDIDTYDHLNIAKALYQFNKKSKFYK